MGGLIWVKFVKMRNSGLNGIRTHDLCDTGAVYENFVINAGIKTAAACQCEKVCAQSLRLTGCRSFACYGGREKFQFCICVQRGNNVVKVSYRKRYCLSISCKGAFLDSLHDNFSDNSGYR